MKFVKNVGCLLLAVVMLLGLTGCTDVVDAIATVSTSTGQSATVHAYTSGDLLESKVEFFSPSKETIHVDFVCPECGYEETYETSTATPQTKLLRCKCDGSAYTKVEMIFIITGPGEEKFICQDNP